MWDGFLTEIMNGNPEMIDFLARAAGYTLSGDTGIQAMFFLSGSGANGKGVFLEALRHVIGGYAQDASFETFIDSKNKSEHRKDLAALAGARFVTASESQDGHRLDEALIKKLTGVQNSWGGGKNFIPKGIGMVAAVGLEPTTYGL